jgi:hypothetical protein
MDNGLPSRLVFVYDADGTLRGEITYIVGHLLGKLECAMCDISHGPTGRRASWKRWEAALTAIGIAVETLHRDELDHELLTCIANRYPCVVSVSHANEHEFVLGKSELHSCSGKIAPLHAALQARGLLPDTLAAPTS